MPLQVKQGRKVGIFLKDNIPTDKSSFVEREVYVTLQGSRTGKETKVKLKINAGRRHPAIQSSTGAVTLSSVGQIVETFNPSLLPEEVQEEIKEKLVEKLEELKEEKITKPKPIKELMDEVKAKSKVKKPSPFQKSRNKAAALAEKLASKGIGKSSGEGSGKGKTTYTPPASRTAPAQRTTVDDYDDFDDFGDDFGGR